MLIGEVAPSRVAESVFCRFGTGPLLTLSGKCDVSSK